MKKPPDDPQPGDLARWLTEDVSTDDIMSLLGGWPDLVEELPAQDWYRAEMAGVMLMGLWEQKHLSPE